MKNSKIVAYQFYQAALKLILHKENVNILLLKCPSHLQNLVEISKVFNVRSIIWLHRNPIEAISSGLDMNIRMIKHKINIKQYAKKYIEYYLYIINKAIRDLEKFNIKCLHVSFNDLVNKPVSCMEEIYRTLNLPYDSVMKGKWLDYIKENQRYKYGYYKHSLSDFNLKKKQIIKYFSDYYSKYSIYWEYKVT